MRVSAGPKWARRARQACWRCGPKRAPRWGGVEVRPAIREARHLVIKGTQKLRGTEVPRDPLEGVSQREDAWEAHEDAAGGLGGERGDLQQARA